MQFPVRKLSDFNDFLVNLHWIQDSIVFPPAESWLLNSNFRLGRRIKERGTMILKQRLISCQFFWLNTLKGIAKAPTLPFVANYPPLKGKKTTPSIFTWELPSHPPCNVKTHLHFCCFFISRQVDFKLTRVCSVIDHRWRQNVVRTSETHLYKGSCVTPGVIFKFSAHFDVTCKVFNWKGRKSLHYCRLYCLLRQRNGPAFFHTCERAFSQW